MHVDPGFPASKPCPHRILVVVNKDGILTGRAAASREIFFRSPFPLRGPSENEEKIT
jgi:hypothetical protein